MAITKTFIANMALSHIGKDGIEDFNEKSAAARAIRDFYDHARRQALEAFNWNFARKRAALALSSDAPPDGVWAFRYQYPVDCVVIRYLQNPGSTLFVPRDWGYPGTETDAIAFQIEVGSTGGERTILTNLENAVAIYTFDQQICGVYSQFFIDMLSHLLASQIAIRLTGKRSLKADEINTYNALVRIGPAHNAQEGLSEPPRDAEWVRGR